MIEMGEGIYRCMQRWSLKCRPLICPPGTFSHRGEKESRCLLPDQATAWLVTARRASTEAARARRAVTVVSQSMQPSVMDWP